MTHLPQVLSSYSVDYHNGRSIITHKKDRETTRETSPAKNNLPKHFNKQRAQAVNCSHNIQLKDPTGPKRNDIYNDLLKTVNNARISMNLCSI